MSGLKIKKYNCATSTTYGNVISHWDNILFKLDSEHDKNCNCATSTTYGNVISHWDNILLKLDSEYDKNCNCATSTRYGNVISEHDKSCFLTELWLLTEAATWGVSTLKNSGFKNIAIFTGKHLWCSIFLIKLQVFRLATYLKETPTPVFSCEYYKIVKETCFEKHLQTAASVLNPCAHEYAFEITSCVHGNMRKEMILHNRWTGINFCLPIRITRKLLIICVFTRKLFFGYENRLT